MSLKRGNGHRVIQNKRERCSRDRNKPSCLLMRRNRKKAAMSSWVRLGVWVEGYTTVRNKRPRRTHRHKQTAVGLGDIEVVLRMKMSFMALKFWWERKKMMIWMWRSPKFIWKRGTEPRKRYRRKKKRQELKLRIPRWRNQKKKGRHQGGGESTEKWARQ